MTSTAIKKIGIARSARTRKIAEKSFESPGRTERTKKGKLPESSALAAPTPLKGNSMPSKSSGGIVRKTADQLPPTTPADLNRLRRAMERSEARIDHDKGPKLGSRPIRRDANGRIVKLPPSRIRSAILDELGRREMTRYKLWRIARQNCPTLPQSAVYEFLRGFRQIGLGYVEALLVALDLNVVAMSGHHAKKG